MRAAMTQWTYPSPLPPAAPAPAHTVERTTTGGAPVVVDFALPGSARALGKVLGRHRPRSSPDTTQAPKFSKFADLGGIVFAL